MPKKKTTATANKPKHKVITSPHKLKSQTDIWKVSAIVFAGLFLLSIFNGGFGLKTPSVKTLMSQAERLEQKTDDSGLKSALGSVKTSLEPYVEVKKTSNYDGDKVTIVEYSDYQCPYCKRAEDDAVAKIKKNFGEAVEIDYRHFPLSFHQYAQKAAEASECARDQDKFREYHDKLFENQGSLDAASLKKYAKGLGLDTTKFDACLDGGEKSQIVKNQFLEGQQKGVSGTPAFFIGDQMISGAQPYEAFLPAICAKIPEHDACLNTPKPVEFKMIVLSDKNCADCDSSNIVGAIKQMFSGIEVEYLDYNTKDGKKLYDEIGLVYMPMYLMEKSVKDDPGYSKIAGAMVEKGDYLAVQPRAAGATYDPNAEQCTNGVDDNGDGIVDCDDAKCAASLECRAVKKNMVDLFIMSDCPYGKKAVEGLKDAIDNFGDTMDYDIHYIASEAGSSFSSLHGQYEWEEDVRQLCAKKLDSSKYFDYVYCRSVNGIKGVDWKQCAISSGFEVNAMQTCIDDEGKDLLREDIKIANSLGVSASPTWLANNRYKFSGLDGETIRSNFCKYNEGASGCENTLSTDTGGVPAGNC